MRYAARWRADLNGKYRAVRGSLSSGKCNDTPLGQRLTMSKRCDSLIKALPAQAAVERGYKWANYKRR